MTDIPDNRRPQLSAEDYERRAGDLTNLPVSLTHVYAARDALRAAADLARENADLRDCLMQTQADRDELRRRLEVCAIRNGDLHNGCNSNGCEVVIDTEGHTWVRNLRAEAAEAERDEYKRECQRLTHKLSDERDDHERSHCSTIEQRDAAEDSIQETHIALGGDGEWCAKMGSAADVPPNSGDLNADTPELARIVMARAEAAERESAELREKVRVLREAITEIRNADVTQRCCGNPSVGAEYLGVQEQVCCGNPDIDFGVFAQIAETALAATADEPKVKE